jgi:poly-gamma-glutamate synthesis protein (capsule biosynthesis protein)
MDPEAASVALTPDPATRPTPPPKQRPAPEGNWYDEPLERTPASTRTFEPPENISKKTRRLSKKTLIISLIIILLLAAGGAVYWFVIKPKHQSKPVPAATQANNEVQAPKALSGNFRMIATGDIITHDSVNQNAKKPDGSYDYAPMLSEIKPLISKADTRICHDTVSTAGASLGITGYPSFNAPTELLTGLASSGCNILSLASDHIGDKGQAAIDATLQAVDAQKEIVLSAGANRSAEERAKDRYFNIGDGVVKFAYFSYTAKQNKPSTTPYGVNAYDKATVAADIKKVRETANFVIVSMCWGKEDSGDIQPDQDRIAQELADAGADVVFGHCTHIVQPVKQVKSTDGARSTIVYYSLGNTLNSQLPVETLIGGIAVIDIDLATKKITSAGFMPTYMHYEWTPAQKAAKDINSRKNLKLYPLDKAEAPLAASQNGTTVAAQTARITEILNRFTPTKILKSTDLL